MLTHANEWVVSVDASHDSYGPYEGVVEGVVEGHAASGHPLKWFAPAFGTEIEHWRKRRMARAAFAVLAIRMSRSNAGPIIVREGPLGEERRQELRKEGKLAEAESPDLSVELMTDELRTFYSTFHDHHEFVGEVLEVRSIRPRPEFRLELECLPDELETG